MSGRNLSYRHSYIEQHLTDDESSESITSYMDDMGLRRKHSDRRDSAGRSIRSSRQSLKSSPQRSFDEDSETFSRRTCRQNGRERRASSSARSIASRSERRPYHRVKSDSTQESETELGTRALVQAKILEKVAQASSMDESSSDLWKPKSMLPAKVDKTVPKSSKSVDKTMKTISKPVEPKKSVESVLKPKVQTSRLSTQNPGAKFEKSIRKVENATPKIEKHAAKIELPKSVTEHSEVVDCSNVPDEIADGPPKTPDYDWTCEYCTFVNEPNVKICAVCCKTPSSIAIRKQTSPENVKKPPMNGKFNDSADISKEGRTKKLSRKISFWPGTKQAK